MTSEDLRAEFEKEEGMSWMNEQGEPDVEYVWWLENKITRLEKD